MGVVSCSLDGDGDLGRGELVTGNVDAERRKERDGRSTIMSTVWSFLILDS